MAISESEMSASNQVSTKQTMSGENTEIKILRLSILGNKLLTLKNKILRGGLRLMEGTDSQITCGVVVEVGGLELPLKKRTHEREGSHSHSQVWLQVESLNRS